MEELLTCRRTLIILYVQLAKLTPTALLVYIITQNGRCLHKHDRAQMYCEVSFFVKKYKKAS